MTQPFENNDLDQSLEGVIDLQAPEESQWYIPPGTYLAMPTRAEKMRAKAKPGETQSENQYIKVDFQILSDSPKVKGKKITLRLNIKNNNEVAQDIGRRQLRQLALALGLTKLSHTNELVSQNKPVSLDIKDSINKMSGEKQSEIKFIGAVGNSTKPLSNSVINPNQPVAPAEPPASWDPDATDPDAI